LSGKTFGSFVEYSNAADIVWDTTVDVVVAGSGAAGWSAALGAILRGASVSVLEKESTVGGTTAKAGGGLDDRASAWFWICNHPWLKELGITDSKDDTIRYLARLARPEIYNPKKPNLGLPRDDYELLVTFYERGAEAISALSDCGALPLNPLEHTLDYFADLPENTTPRGRGLYFARHDGTEGTGADIVESMKTAALQLGVSLSTSSPLQGLILDEDSAVIGVSVGDGASGSTRIRARHGVVMATGGFTRNVELMRSHLRGPIVGSLASDGNTGDLVNISAELGLDLANMNEAWYAPLVLDHAHKPVSAAFRLPGDSMILVNRAGRRAVNEKTSYNEMTRAFFEWNSATASYANLPLIMIYDESVSQRCRAMPSDAPVTEGGGNPLPRKPGDDHEIVATTWAELAQKIDSKLAEYDHVLPGAQLDQDFLATLDTTITRWNSMSGIGKDDDFGRGGTSTERRRSGEPRQSDMPNPTMHAFSEEGPFYAVILVPGTLDSRGGPRIDTNSRLLRSDGTVVEGLYGAGNCIASPAGQAYWAGGTTLGLAATFGWIAGTHAASRALDKG
jgi:succinate dehydrogenase/fumarate reductase flavoprotein subunit